LLPPAAGETDPVKGKRRAVWSVALAGLAVIGLIAIGLLKFRLKRLV
jgi:hypothetical protein